jgi:hypothetical protein
MSPILARHARVVDLAAADNERLPVEQEVVRSYPEGVSGPSLRDDRLHTFHRNETRLFGDWTAV